jgi:hypothetical protein
MERAEASGATNAPTTAAPRPAAIAGGVPISRDDLWPLLAERAGREVLEEVVLDERLRKLCDQQAITITDADRENEKRTLLATMSRRSGLTPDEAEKSLLDIRRGRGLGPDGFTRLLDRNAKLRRLSAPEVRVTPEEIAQGVERRFGIRYAARVILVKSEQDAATARAALEQAPDLGAKFSRIAREKSIDASAASGGVLPDVSASDAAYPREIRTALRSLTPGQVSAVLAVDTGFAIVLLDEIIPARADPSDSDREQVAADLRVNAERAAMEQLARRLVQESGVTAMDTSLRWSWETATR